MSSTPETPLGATSNIPRCDAVTFEGRCPIEVVSARDNEIMGQAVEIKVKANFCLFHGLILLTKSRNPLGLFPIYRPEDAKHPLPYWKPND